ncbi:TPA: ABC transporter permease [Candidatus Woesearchaeota archaeon]|jgi:ABC-2 type transport system permease protein|nr:ABC transporter permease [archaeon]HIJ10724.1 ABC transporter permease [Candidatus Woesearchaeota archaeon]
MSYTALATLTRREISRVLRIWTQSLIPPILTSSLFIVIFGYSLGSRITDIAGVSYLEFIVPGLLMMGVIMSAYAATSFSLYLQKFQGSVQELLVAPISYWEIIAGLTIGALVRALLVGVGILVVSLFFTNLTVYSYGILLFFIVMTSLLFAFAGIVTALWAKNFDQMSVFSTFLITPLTYLGGVFYSIQMLPPLWQTVAQFNPVLYMVDGFRYGFLGFSDIPLMYSVGIITGLTLIFFVLCVHLFKKGYNLRS